MLINGDSLLELKKLPDNSIDSLVTDPPAGINFMGKEWDSHKGGRKEWCAWLESVMREVHRVLKPGAHGLVWAIPRTSHWTATALEDSGFEIRDCITHLFGSGFPKSLNISKAIDKAAGAEREVVGHQSYSAPDIRGNSYDQSHVGDRERLGVPITKASSDEAKQWDGWGTALKPAAEFWWLIRKPISEKTVADNVLKWGTGGINIDGCRVGTESVQTNFYKGEDAIGAMKGSGVKNKTEYATPKTGRFPANLILDEDAGAMLDEQSGNCKSAGKYNDDKKDKVFENKDSLFPLGHNTNRYAGEIGGASRFFYCAKVSTSERGEGNRHPTVKAIKLMTYLCRLITPPNGTILDPFMGSGSTGIAAGNEGFKFIGIEKEKEYFEIASNRINSFE